MFKTLYAVAALYSEDMRNLEERQEEFLSVDASAWDMKEDIDEGKPYQVVNGLATYSIRGKMLDESNFFTQIFGIATYQDISETLAAMAQDEEVEQILIDFSSPGGMVSGISDISDNWKQLNAVKPITVHTPGMLASAAMWLAANSTDIYASPTAEAGSIGVILNHVSQEKALDKAGIKVTEIKSAPLKAVGSPAKDLTEAEIAHLQKKVDESAQLFTLHMYKSRPALKAEALTGETFKASEAYELGLIDGVKTYSEVFTDLVSAAADTHINTLHMEEYAMKKKVTADQFEAAVAAGASPDTMEVISQEEFDAIALETGTGTETETSKSGETEEATESSETAEGSEEIDPVELLNAEVEQLSDDLAVAVDENKQLKDRISELQADAEAMVSLREFAIDRLSTMRVALGLQKVEMEDFTTSMLVTEYTAIDKAFKKSFKVGGVAPAAATEEPKKTAKVTNIDRARLSAVGLN